MSKMRVIVRAVPAESGMPQQDSLEFLVSCGTVQMPRSAADASVTALADTAEIVDLRPVATLTPV